MLWAGAFVCTNKPERAIYSTADPEKSSGPREFPSSLRSFKAYLWLASFFGTQTKENCIMSRSNARRLSVARVPGDEDFLARLLDVLILSDKVTAG